MNYIILVIGLLILIKGADVFIESASKIAHILHISPFIIGLFVVAIGTSAPEASIGIISGIQGANLITLGDVVGSSIVNILVVIGITAIIFPLKIDSRLSLKELLISIFVQFGLFMMIFTGLSLSRIEGIVFLLGMLSFSGYIFIKSRKDFEKENDSSQSENHHFDDVKDEEVDELYEELEELKETGELLDFKLEHPTEENKTESMLKLLVMFLIGLVGLVGGANLVVNSAVKIAQALGLSETFIGLTIIAFGTSLPELVTCLVAVYKKQEEIAVGNIIGSNIFNILLVLGLSVTLHPITITPDIFFDISVMIGASILFFVSIFFFGKISRGIGVVYLIIYFIYLGIKLNGVV